MAADAGKLSPWFSVAFGPPRLRWLDAMRRLIIPRKLRLAFILAAALTLLLGLRYEMDYRDQLNHLPALVDAHGNTATLEAAMAGLDAYGIARQTRTCGFISFGAGALLCAGAAATKPRSKGAHES